MDFRAGDMVRAWARYLMPAIVWVGRLDTKEYVDNLRVIGSQTLDLCGVPTLFLNLQHRRLGKSILCAAAHCQLLRRPRAKRHWTFRVERTTAPTQIKFGRDARDTRRRRTTRISSIDEEEQNSMARDNDSALLEIDENQEQQKAWP